MSLYQHASDWVEANFAEVLRLIGYLDSNPQPPDQLPEKIKRLNLCHGDKAPQYEERWKVAGVPYHYGLSLYLLSYLPPYSATVRYVNEGWVDPCQWVIDQYGGHIELFQQVSALARYKTLMEKYQNEGLTPAAAHRQAEFEANRVVYGTPETDFDV